MFSFVSVAREDTSKKRNLTKSDMKEFCKQILEPAATVKILDLDMLVKE